MGRVMPPDPSAPPLPFLVPYLNDPRRRITLNFHADDYAALTDDAARAGHASPGKYALALVQARGAAAPPVLDENGRQRVAALKGKLAAAREAVTAAEARAEAIAPRLRAAQHELTQRPSRAEIERLLVAAVAAAMAQRGTATPTAETVPTRQHGAHRNEG